MTLARLILGRMLIRVGRADLASLVVGTLIKRY